MSDAPSLERTVKVHVLARRILVWSVVTEAVLLVLDVVITYFDVFDDLEITRLFNLAREGSIPSWFAVVQTAFIGVIALSVMLVARSRGDRSMAPRGWAFAGVVFLFWSIDDASELHERLGTYLKEQFDATDLPSFGWQHFIMPIYAAAGLVILLWLWRPLARHGLLGWILVGGVLVAVAQGLDHLEGMKGAEGDDDLYDTLADWLGARRYAVSHTLRCTEEVLEMLGFTLIGQSFLRSLAHASDGMRFTLRGPGRWAETED